MGTSTRPDGRFATMDALRGIAAVGVMFFHAERSFVLHLPGGYLAVDLFFGLSGFVIAYAYQERLREGFAAREFLIRRAIRLWPMVLLGAVLAMVLHGGHAGMLFLLPNWKSDGLLYPSNPPMWSLLFEAIAYCAFALVLHRLGNAALMAIMGASALALTALALSPGHFTDFGADWASFGGGLARVGYAFTAGVLVFRWHDGSASRTSALAWVLAFPLVIGFLAIGGSDNLAALGAVLLGVPSIVALAARIEVPQRRLAALLGDVSYPLYCIHVPLLALAAGLSNAATLAVCLAITALSLALDRGVDHPARRWLEMHLRRAPARRDVMAS